MSRQGGILGYARASTVDQDLSAQIVCLKEIGAVRVFTDIMSGKSFARPGLSALMEQAKPGDTLAVIRLDRLGRSLKELLDMVDQLGTQNAGLISLEEKIDTISATGELVFHFFGAIAHFERRLISERTCNGIAAGRARGKRPGRPPLDQEKLEAALRLVASGLSATQAVRQVSLGRSTLYRELRRRAEMN